MPACISGAAPPCRAASANAFAVYAKSASNSEIVDEEGKKYIDFAGGIAVVNTGHCHPKIIAAVKEQVENLTHACFQVTPYEPYIRLAERLNKLTPGDFAKKTIFLTTGAEAVENAVKIARAYTRRAGIIAFSGAFHGRTMMGMALTGKYAPYKIGFGPFPSDVYHVPFPDPALKDGGAAALKHLETIFKADIGPDNVAAIIIEPVQGEGGFNIVPFEFMQALREICNKHGIVFIVDEIQSGFARTGKMFACEHSGVEPDLVTMAKSMAGGFPLSAVTGRAEIMDAPAPGGLGGHLCRLADRLCRGQCRARRDGRGKSARARQCHRQAHARAPDRHEAQEQLRQPDRRHPRPGRHGGLRLGEVRQRTGRRSHQGGGGEGRR